MARSIAQLKHGEPHEALELLQQPIKPTASPGCVVVRITVRPINPIDLLAIRNDMLLKLPHRSVIGSEGFGIVEEVGEGVSQFCPGQRVVPMVWLEHHRHGQGSWQDYVELKEENVVAVPSSVSDEAAAQFLVNPWTVYGMLDDLAVPKGEYLLQTAAASVLGRELIQLARHWGIKTINVVRRDAWKSELKALGADEVINSETEDIVERVKEITGGKLAYAAVDAVGGVLTKTVGATVREDGKLFVYGALSGWEVTVSTHDLLRGVQLSFWQLPKYIRSAPAKHAHAAAEVMKLLEEKVITPLSGKKFPLEDFLAAIEESEKQSRGGKVLLVS